MDTVLLFKILFWVAFLFAFAYIILIIEAGRIISNKMRLLSRKKHIRLWHKLVNSFIVKQ